MKIIGVIPARLGSTRLPEKVLKPIAGRPMIQHVWERAKKAKQLTDLIIACDDPRVEACIKSFGGKAVMTDPQHPNGSSRVAEIARKTEGDVFLNIQGDEPLIHPEGIDQLAKVFEKNQDLQVATLAVRRHEQEDYENPNVVKVICDKHGNALYFSRSPLPYFRDKANAVFSYLKHLGIYAYRKDFLLKFVTWPIGILEDQEKLEQLRILEQGISIRVMETPFDAFSVDTQDDLEFVENKLKASAELA